MVDDESLDYYRRRERAERAAAKNAASEAARRAHQELAQEYADLLRAICYADSAIAALTIRSN